MLFFHHQLNKMCPQLAVEVVPAARVRVAGSRSPCPRSTSWIHRRADCRRGADALKVTLPRPRLGVGMRFALQESTQTCLMFRVPPPPSRSEPASGARLFRKMRVGKSSQMRNALQKDIKIRVHVCGPACLRAASSALSRGEQAACVVPREEAVGWGGWKSCVQGRPARGCRVWFHPHLPVSPTNSPLSRLSSQAVEFSL